MSGEGRLGEFLLPVGRQILPVQLDGEYGAFPPGHRIPDLLEDRSQRRVFPEWKGFRSAVDGDVHGTKYSRIAGLSKVLGHRSSVPDIWNRLVRSKPANGSRISVAEYKGKRRI